MSETRANPSRAVALATLASITAFWLKIPGRVEGKSMAWLQRGFDAGLEQLRVVRTIRSSFPGDIEIMVASFEAEKAILDGLTAINAQMEKLIDEEIQFGSPEKTEFEEMIEFIKKYGPNGPFILDEVLEEK